METPRRKNQTTENLIKDVRSQKMRFWRIWEWRIPTL